MPAYQVTAEDRVQKTWIPEGTKEYAFFKLVTLENLYLARILKEAINLKSGELILDIGGRHGDIALALQNPENIHIIRYTARILHYMMIQTNLIRFN